MAVHAQALDFIDDFSFSIFTTTFSTCVCGFPAHVLEEILRKTLTRHGRRLSQKLRKYLKD
jgi:hypothetical protein